MAGWTSMATLTASFEPLGLIVPSEDALVVTADSYGSNQIGSLAKVGGLG